MQAEPDFSALLRPHRAMSPKGIRVVMVVTAGLAAIPGLVFFSMGAWPVVGLLGLEVMALYWAMNASFRSGDAYEEVRLWRHDLQIRHVTASGAERHHAFNPYWVKLDIARDREDRITRIALRNRGETVEVGSFLTPAGKKKFASGFSAALYRARN